MGHKERCEELRKIRISLADKLGIGDKVKRTPCEFNGECTGTCPACQEEEKFLNKELFARAAVIAGASLALTGCESLKPDYNISGDIQIVDEDIVGMETVQEDDYDYKDIDKSDNKLINFGKPFGD